MLYILGSLCFVAIAVAAVMLILSINLRRINTRFWSIFLCCSLVCSFAFYGVNRSVLSKKEPPVIDFSGIVPHIEEEVSEEAQTYEEISEETAGTEEKTNDEAETEILTETEQEQSSSSQNSASQQPPADNVYDVPQEEIQGNTASSPELPDGEQAAGNEEPLDIPDENYEDFTQPGEPEVLPGAPPEIEIEYEGPFRTE